MIQLGARGLVAATSTHANPGWVTIEGPVITEVGVGEAPKSCESIADAILIPGFVDLQINGVEEIDFAKSSGSRICEALDRLTNDGCTTCFPTLVTAPESAYPTMLDAVAAARGDSGADARCAIGGVHLEGPFLGGAPGAHPVDLIRQVDMTALISWVARHRDLVRVVTLAPEADPMFEATRHLTELGIVVAIGHTGADYSSCLAMIDAGASLVTHLFNGMTAFHHREPGPIGAALTDKRLVASIILDGVHVHPAAALVAINSKESIAIITDAVAVGAHSAGVVELAVGVDGAARLRDGTLAGSTLTMLQAVRNAVRFGVGIERAIDMATRIPANVAGLSDRGSIEVGKRADLIALDRDSLDVRGVWIGGARVR